LSRCDRQAPLSRRNYAILLLLARLGLRAGEVVARNLEDIDWEAGQMTVHGKGGRSTQMPLPTDVGEAIAAYPRNGRPRCSSRRVFIRAKAPLDGCCVRKLATTNPIESCLSTVQWVARNVKRWREGDQPLRWTATGLLEAEKKFRRIKGYQEILLLKERLNPSRFSRRRSGQ